MIQQCPFWVFTQTEQNTHTKDICTLVFMAALFTTAMKWKQPKYPQQMKE